MTSRQLRTARLAKAARKFAAMSPEGIGVSCLLDSLLDSERLADIAANDAAAGIAAPPVERDEEFFTRVDLSQPTAEERERRKDRAALELQINRTTGALIHG